MLQIKEFILRVPRLSNEDACSLAEEVNKRLANVLPAQYTNRYLDAFDLGLSVPAGTSRSKLAKLIAEVVLKGLV